ncbi:glycosyltransferase family 2 protein [uncultured Methylobacterium sp.]|uniref:glycosyltransferase family 2 protein n=1 Tax=uncultured Methylobacterium sp. TaxID=157278 RepID=UPI00262D5C3F|nr:glycosyltransferase family 2 protein [uncultured Methylobacterium sp.]
MMRSEKALAGPGPTFTIAIPTFNRAHHLRACLASALAQTCPDFEVVVSDNASTDATPEVLAAYDDPRLRILRQPHNIGLISNWNACLRAARGAYIVILSDDDAAAPDFLARCAALIASHPGIPIVVGLSDLHAQAFGRTHPARRSRRLRTGVCAGTAVLSEFLNDRISVTMCSVVMRTSVLRGHGGIQPRFPHMADIVAWMPMLLLGEAGFVNEPCATFTYHDGSATSRMGAEQRLLDGARVVGLVSDAARSSVADLDHRVRIDADLRGFFARRGLLTLSDQRRAGAGAWTLLTLAWRYRRDLAAADLRAAAAFAAKVVLPRAAGDWLRRLSFRRSETGHFRPID